MRRYSILFLILFFACAPTDSKNHNNSGNDAVITDTSKADLSEETSDSVVQTAGKYPASANPDQKEALFALNNARKAVGLPIVNELATLNKSSRAHADFITHHCLQYANLGLSPHEEDKAYGDDFTGVKPWDRMMAAGYKGNGWGEVIAFYASPDASVNAWVNSLYHRLLIFDPGLLEIGYGKSIGPASCTGMFRKTDVMDLGLGAPSPRAPDHVFYPPDGGVDIPRAFEGYESPQPPVPKGGYPAGTMITLQMKTDRVQWLGHKITEVDTTREVPHMAISNLPNQEAGVDNDTHAMSGMKPYLALYAYDPLNPDTKYRVVIQINLNGENLGLATTFTTGE